MIPAGSSRQGKWRTGMAKIAGIMMTKNEEAIIGECLSYYAERDIPLAILDDSDDATPVIIQSFDNCILVSQRNVYGRNTRGSGDWMFQAPLRAIRAWANPEFIVIAMGDEIWHHDVVKVIDDMEIEDANYCIVHSCQFFLKKNFDENKWDFDKGEWKQPYNRKNVSEVLSWYSPGYIAERRIFRDAPDLHYAPRQHFDPAPQGAIRGKRYSRNPIIKHYPHQSPAALLARAKDRVEREYQPFYHHSFGKQQEEVFFDNFPGCHESRCLLPGMYPFGEIEAGLEYLL